MTPLRWMMEHVQRSGPAAAALLAALTFAAPGSAQATTPPPLYPAIDGNGVNVVAGTYNVGSTDVVIGQPGAGGLSYSWAYDSAAGVRHNWHGYVAVTSYPTTMVVVGSHAESFTQHYSGYPNPPTFTPDQATGSTLTYGTGAHGAEYTYRTADGVTYTFAWVGLTSITYPSGEVVTLHWATGGYSVWQDWPFLSWRDEIYSRLQSVTNNFGYQLHFEYATDAVTSYSNEYIVGDVPDSGWDAFVGVRGINMAVDWCDPTGGTCSGFTETWPVAQYGGGWTPATVTDSLSRTVTYSYSSGRMTEVQFPDHADHDIAISYYTSGTYEGWVSSVDRGWGTWSYAYADAGGERTTTITDPASNATLVVSDAATGRILEVTDPLNRTTLYSYDGNGRLTAVELPEGNKTQYSYDARGNVTETRAVAKPGSGLADIVTSATYPGSCSNPVTCNKPATTTDARGFVTNYSYDATHGGVTSVLAPASGSGPYSTTRAETRFSYATYQARYKSGASSWTNGGAVYRLVETSACATGSSCDATADETVTTATYPGSGTPNNLLPSSITTAAGNNAVSAATAMTYTPQGDVKTVDGPLSGSADTTRFYYDAARQLTGVVGPDPDGSGGGNPLLNRAVRTSYNTIGQAHQVERGTVTSQADNAFSSFTALEKQDTLYDSYGRPVQSRLWNGGLVVALSQMSYDAVGRPRCAAQRMNPSEFNPPYAPPADACDDAAGGAEADRISRTSYDAAGQVTTVESAVDTPFAQTTIEYGYTANGLVDWFDDASNNRTNPIYDGFDRLVRTEYPQTTVGTETPNSADYTATTYDAYGLVTATRRRDGASFAFSYDNLGRTTLADAPSGTPDVATTYDLMGRALTIAHAGETLTNVYDQLSRLTSTTSSVLGAVSYQYDAAGRRTRLTWPDSAYVTYDWNVGGDLTGIKESGSTSLASFTHDNLGRRTGLTRGNGVVTSYAYDAVSRLASLVQDAAGTDRDQTIGFSYNPASQITARTRTNPAYDWISSGATGTTTTSYADNGLNQYTTVGGVSHVWGARGNLGTDGAKTYGYDDYNRLVSASGGVTLGYDPAGRLHQVAGGSTTRFLYDGADVIAELNTSGTVLRRYVHGPGTDEPIVWYEGSSTSSKSWLMADERGSVVAVSNSAGTVTAVNTYDAYGKPGSANTGRFQYTGQMWIAEIGLYHYKARAYHPGLGRFLQTDPIGVAGGMNLYGYVGNDPINGRDPSGLQAADHAVVTCGPGCAFGGGLSPSSGSGYAGGGDYSSLIWAAATAAGLTPDDFYAAQNAQFPSRPAAASGEQVDHIVVLGERIARRVNGFVYDLGFGRGYSTYGPDSIWSWSYADSDFVHFVEGYIAVMAMVSPGGASRGAVGIGAKLCGCFEAGAEVATPDGPRAIEDIEVGDLVLAWNEETGEVAPKAVTALIRPEPRDLYALTLADAQGTEETFSVTDDHPWMVEGQGWTETIALAPGDRIETATEQTLVVASLAFTSEIAQTYNLEIDGWHTFLVGDGQVVVHNGPGCLSGVRLFQHHIFPRQFADWFASKGINIDQYTVALGQASHLRGIHGAGLGNMPGGWNARWAAFIGRSPNATAKEVFQYGGSLMDEYGINHVPIIPYR